MRSLNCDEKIIKIQDVEMMTWQKIREHLENSGKFWNIREHSGTFENILEHSRTF